MTTYSFLTYSKTICGSPVCAQYNIVANNVREARIELNNCFIQSSYILIKAWHVTTPLNP